MIFLNKVVMEVVFGNDMDWLFGGFLRLFYDVTFGWSFDWTFCHRHIPFTLNLQHSIINVGLFSIYVCWLFSMVGWELLCCHLLMGTWPLASFMVCC